MAFAGEIQEKELRVRQLMENEGLDALAITSICNFAWLTCGGNNYVGIAAENGNATAVITKTSKYIVCDNIEAQRIADEEIEGQGYEVRSFQWYEGGRDAIISEIAGGGALGSDIPMPGAKNTASALDQCRQQLTSEEVDRYRWLGRNTGECIEAAAREIEPGMSEHQIAGILDGHLYSRGITPTVTLIAVDERIEAYRHPIPTDKKLSKCAMLVTGARKWGLIVSATRMVHFGPVSDELRRKHDAVAEIDATFIVNTRPGANIGDIFRLATVKYAETGFPNEWQLHHQGGPTGYKGREFRANLQSDALVVENQAFAWNPSITGTKTEDTIIATVEAPEIISATPDWPKVSVETGARSIERPDILVR